MRGDGHLQTLGIIHGVTVHESDRHRADISCRLSFEPPCLAYGHARNV